MLTEEKRNSVGEMDETILVNEYEGKVTEVTPNTSIEQDERTARME